MMNNDTPVVKDLVLIGGGHSHVSVLRKFGMKPLPGVRLTVICRDVHTPYSGMLPGLIAGHYDFDDAHIDLGPLSQFANARFYRDDVIGLDLEGKRVLCANRPPVPYDLLSINIGSAPVTQAIPGARENVVPVKPIANFFAHWERLRDRVVERGEAVRIGVVGGGAGGVELLLAVQHRLTGLLSARGRNTDHLSFHLITDMDDILHTHNRRVGAIFQRVLRQRGVQVHTGHAVMRVEPGLLICENQASIALDEILWVTSAGAAAWLGESGLDVDDEGFVTVDDCLQSTSHPGIFAAGDIAAMVNHPRPKSGVFAVRQGPPLARNLRRHAKSQPLRAFTPQRKFLGLISTGDKYAVASRADWAREGRLLWRWKDWIDRRFMRKYNELPEMDDNEKPNIARGVASAAVIKEISAIAMRCGGCGAKVGATVLTRALSQLNPVARPEVLIGLHAPDDAAVVDVGAKQVIVHTVDSFRAMIDDPYTFGQIAANHSLGDIFAMGGDPTTALAIATVPYGIEAKVEDDLTQMMQGAMLVLKDANTALIGGHTSEGAELSLGFAINGLVERAQIMRKGGMKPGDRLILTKAIGTGTLFAADMRLKAKGRWISGALESMLQSNQAGAQCLHEFGATACTDVTGFGVLGHLVEMTKPSKVDVEIDLGAVPILDGALETVQAGIVSSLQPQNVRLRRAIRDLDKVGNDPRYPLLFDPQTAGGMLASVPGDRADECVEALRRIGYLRTAIIGTIRPEGNQIEPVSLIL
jgi:selenide,water dikinase